MLYQIYEMQRRAFAPIRMMFDHGQYFFRNPLNPLAYTATGRAMAAACEVWEHSTRHYGKPEFGLKDTQIGGRTVAVREEVILDKPFGQLLHFARDTKHNDPKLLLVAPLSGHFATLLRGTVKAMLSDHDVYITDWRDAKEVPLRAGRFNLEDYISYIITFLEKLGPDCHVIAVCQPAVPVAAAVAHMSRHDHPCLPNSMTLMGGPIDTRINPTQVNQFAKQRPLSWFESRVITRVPPDHAGFMREVYPGFLQLAGFLSMNIEKHMARHHDMFTHLVEGDGESAEATQAFYEEYRAVMDLTAEFYLDCIDKVFQRHLLPKGELIYEGETIDLASITKTAILTVEGERDDISGLGQTRAIHGLTPHLAAGKKRHHEQKNVGHYGIFNGRKWREDIAPLVKEFIRK